MPKTEHQSNNGATEESILAFMKKFIVRKEGGYIPGLELYVEYLKLTKSDVSEEDFFRIVEKNDFEKGSAPFDDTYVNISWIDPSITAARFK